MTPQLPSITLPGITRRGALAGTAAGAVLLRFSLRPAAAQPAATAPAADLPGSLQTAPGLDAWIRIDANSAVTVFTGKAELGQGIRTALLQVAAEELEIPLPRITLVTADTARTPNEGYTAGSHSMVDSGTAIRNAAAQVRDILINQAAERLGLAASALRATDGSVVAPDGRRLEYGALVAGNVLDVAARPASRLKDPAQFTVMNHPVPRVDIPAKVTGGAAYVQDMRLPGMVHARVVRPSGPGARLQSLDTEAVERMQGVLKVVRDGDFLAVVAEREFQAVQAMRALEAAARWSPGPALPKQADILATLHGLPSQEITILDRHGGGPAGQKTLQARCSRQYLAHGSIGPSCAMAQFQGGRMTIWTHTQGVYPDRAAIAEMLHMPPAQVRCIHVEGSGCYGHNGADDAAADAALIARAMPDRPVRLQWMREQENGWEPLAPAMLTEARAGLDAAGNIVAWDYQVWSNTHSTRPGPAGALLAARLLAEPFPEPPPKPIPMPEGGGDRNAIPLYEFPTAKVVNRFIPQMPLRVSAQRSLGATMNVFAIETFMDELALEAGADPVAFRLRHLQDPRARDVIAEAAGGFGWTPNAPAPPGRGYGFAFARYKNLAAYCAIATEVEVERDTGRIRLLRAVAAVDAGQVVNPDGLRNQIEGGIIQSMSWTLFESVSFGDGGITGLDWSSYPILRFAGVPDSVQVLIVDRPGEPFLGSGEAAQGPAAAAIGNAVAHASGRRLRDLPLSPARVREALNA